MIKPRKKPLSLPLQGIRAFVAVGRHGNFTRAGISLGITQSAVSRHIAGLESCLGITLFKRSGPNAALTPTGTQYFDAVKDAMSTIELATLQTRQGHHPEQRLIVRSSMPSLVHTVLIPALNTFQQREHLQVDLVTSLAPPQVGEPFDILISRDIELSNAEQWVLMREVVICVATPTLYERMQLNNTTTKQEGIPTAWPFIHAKSRPDIMSQWAPAVGLPNEQIKIIASYDHYFLACAAALSGMGFLVAPKILVDESLQNGRLIAVPNTEYWTGATYRAYANPQSKKAAQCAAFCRWLKGLLH